MRIINKIKLVIFCAIIAGTTTVSGQMNLPSPSPKGDVSQVVGLTEIKISYSRPQAKGRIIWDSLVPYNKLWRTGANAATTIELSDDVTVQGQKLAKGKYAILTIPGKDEWTYIFSTNSQTSVDSYKESEDALRVKVKPMKNPLFTQTLTFEFADLTNNSTNLVLDWAGIMIPVKIETDVNALADKNIQSSTSNAWLNFARAANYYLGTNQLDKATEMIDKSLLLQNDFYNHWVKAQVLAKSGNYKDALIHAEKSMELGANAGANSSYRFYKDGIETAIADYKTKSGKTDSKKKK